MPSVNDARHAQLESDVTSYCELKGFRCFSLEYHKHPMGKTLSKIDSFPSHLIRTRADRVIVHSDVVAKFDAKTCRWPTGAQFAIEAIPLMNACLESFFFEVPYLFACRRHDGNEFGFFAGLDAALGFDKILVPEWRRNLERWRPLFARFKKSFGATFAIGPANCNSGGGDPFATLNSSFCDTSPHWRDAIDAITPPDTIFPSKEKTEAIN